MTRSDLLAVRHFESGLKPELQKENRRLAMKTKSRLAGWLFAMALMVAPMASPALANNGNGEKDIVDTAVAAGNFTTLAKALAAAGLIDTLKGQGPFTVFAPTDEAFAKLPAGTLEALLNDTAKLKSILLYHVVPGKVMAKDVVGLKSAKSAQGSSIRITAGKGLVMVDNAKVLKADIACSNGVIHVIDTVILPR
jgi:uncharacterized surface protein with fasciclin (FAS1) repeats